MGIITYSGQKTIANLSTRGTAVTTGALDANAWYEVKAYATSASALPGDTITTVFKTPDTTETAITLAVGDEVYPITLSRICKTDAEVNFEMGTIDVTDDCEEKFNADILDDYTAISGTLNGFAKFDDDTQELSTGTLNLFKRFVNVITDDGAGAYVETKADNQKVLLFICMNRQAAVDEIQNWLIVPALISALAGGAGLKDAQKRDLTWSKAQGHVSIYQRTVYAADVIS